MNEDLVEQSSSAFDQNQSSTPPPEQVPAASVAFSHLHEIDVSSMLEQLGLSRFISDFNSHNITFDVVKGFYLEGRLHELRDLVGFTFGAEVKVRAFLERQQSDSKQNHQRSQTVFKEEEGCHISSSLNDLEFAD